MCWSSFCCCDKMSKSNNLEQERKIYFGIWYRSMVTWLCYWTHCGSEHHGRKHVAKERYLPYSSQESEKESRNKLHLSKLAPGVGGDG